MHVNVEDLLADDDFLANLQGLLTGKNAVAFLLQHAPSRLIVQCEQSWCKCMQDFLP